ncbi:DUF5675 family protein [bacterium]|nr:DUF5675 family protein [bacterium]
MKGLLDAIARFFQSLFGGENTSDPTPTPPVTSQPNTQTGSPVEPSGTSSASDNGNNESLVMELSRYDKGDKDILGKLSVNGEFLCYTLENAESKLHIPNGNYPLSLRDKGGLHATYSYRFGNMHHGMVQVDNVPDADFPFLRIGNMASETDGGFVVGDKVHNENDSASNREVWNSETSYKKVYPKIVGHLQKGGKAEIRIS